MKTNTFVRGVTLLVCLSAAQLWGAEPDKPSGDSQSAVSPEPIHPTGLTLDSDQAAIWQDQIGSGYRKGATEMGVSAGAGLGFSVLGGKDRHDFVMAKVHYGWVVSDLVAKDKWYRGNWVLLGELFGGLQTKPDEAVVFGVTPVLRYEFATGTRWVPFFDAGAGLSATDIGRPDLGGVFEFNLQTGPGVNWYVGRNTAVTLQYRFIHLSSAGLETPNLGVNTGTVYVGINRAF